MSISGPVVSFKILIFVFDDVIIVPEISGER